MNLQELILSRRSIRKYTDQKIDRKTIKILLEAAMSAPSAVARDPWHFYVVTKREMLDRLAEILPYGKMLNHAPLAIIVCGDKNKAYLGETDELGYMVQDCSAATENLMLSAAAMGLGSVWLGVYPQKARMDGIRDLLNPGVDRIPLWVVSLGYPSESQPARTRYREQDISWIE